MKKAQNWQEVPVPARMLGMERDVRGYPVPFIVLRDNLGKPYFAANDVHLVQQANRENRCHICGGKLEPLVWFVGGPGSFLLNWPQALYADGPMHRECLHYAMQVCPQLAARAEQASAPKLQAYLRKNGLFTQDNTVLPGVPDMFVAVGVARWSLGRVGLELLPTYVVTRPFKKVEYWREAVMLPLREGEAEAKRSAKALALSLAKKGSNA